MPEADPPETDAPPPSEPDAHLDARFDARSDARFDARFDARSAASCAERAASIPPPCSTIGAVFVAADGLRAGWGLLLYAALLYALFFGDGLLVHALRRHAAVPQPIASAQAGPPTSMASAPASSTPMPPGTILFGEGTAALSVVVATWLMGKIERRPASVYGLGVARRLRNVLAGFAWGLALLSLLVFTLRGCGLLVFDARLLFGVGALRYGAVWLAGFLLVGLFEESLFRGYLLFTLARGIDGTLRWLRARSSSMRDAGTTATSAVGFWTAALLLSFGFGFAHRSNAGESHLGLLAAALIAVVFCLSLWRTGSLWWAIGFHAAWDWAQSFLFGVADSGVAIQGHLFATHPVGRAILSGGLTGPEGSLFMLPIVALAAVVCVVTLPSHRAGARATLRATALN